MKILLVISLALLFSYSTVAQKSNNMLTKKEARNGWLLLYDGKSTIGWTAVDGKPVPSGWEVENGLLSTKKGSKGGDIVTTQEFGSFILMLDFKIEEGCNSGVKYLFTRYEKGGGLGLEYQVMDDILAEDNRKAHHLCGSLYDVLPPDERTKSKPSGEMEFHKNCLRQKPCRTLVKL